MAWAEICASPLVWWRTAEKSKPWMTIRRMRFLASRRHPTSVTTILRPFGIDVQKQNDAAMCDHWHQCSRMD